MALGRFGALAVLKYNGFDLSANETVLTTSYRVTPVYDQARRTVKWCEFSIGLKWLLHPETAIGPAAEDMVARLTKSGGELVYSGRGTGFESPVNRGVVKDCDHGPRPGAVNMTPDGGHGVWVEWSVSFSIPSCADAVWRGIAEWCFTVSDSYDAERVATRTTSGRLVIANGRTAPGSRDTRDNAGAYLEDVWPPVGPDFELVSNDHQISEDRSTLSYSQVIRERGAAPGLYILSQSGEEGMTTDPGNPYSHVRSIRWKYTIRPDRSAKAAFDHFYALAKDRLARTVSAPGVNATFVSFDARTGDPHQPRQKVSLSLSFRVTNATIGYALGATGMWQPVPNSNRKLWYATVEDVLGPRGKANLIFDPKADTIVDLCRRPASVGGQPAPQPNLPTTTDLRGITDVFPPPTPDASWLHYQVAIRTVIDAGRVVVKTLPEKPLEAELRAGAGPGDADDAPSWLSAGTFAIWAAKSVIAGTSSLPPIVKKGSGATLSSNAGKKPSGGARGGGYGKGDTVIQQRVSPTVYVNVTGRALRHGYSIPHPQITSIDGHPAYLITRGEPGEGFVAGQVRQNAYAVFGARFSLWYVVPGLAKAVTPGGPVQSKLTGRR